MNSIIHKFPIKYYVDRLREREYFSLVSYGDAEWFCVMKHDLGRKTGIGQVIDGPTGDKLRSVIKRRGRDETFLLSIPRLLWELNGCRTIKLGQRIEIMVKRDTGRILEYYERDIYNDDLARDAGLYPFISQLQKMRTVVIGHKGLRGLDFLDYDGFVEISTPNLHLETDGIVNAFDEAMRNYKPDTVYLVSAGVSAPLIIDLLHDYIRGYSFAFDCGSIWDAFVGAGGQREWREKLYTDPERWKEWKKQNLSGRRSDYQASTG